MSPLPVVYFIDRITSAKVIVDSISEGGIGDPTKK
jgi:hypothetical protein